MPVFDFDLFDRPPSRPGSRWSAASQEHLAPVSSFAHGDMFSQDVAYGKENTDP